MTFALGLWMTDVPARADRPYYFAIHASIGITLLAVLAGRLIWAMLNPLPAAPADTPQWRHAAARLTHVSLYGLTFAVAILGWLLAGALRTPIEPQLFGLVPLPAPMTLAPSSKEFVEEAHELVAYVLIGLAGLHALAALWHHYILRDNTLQRMLRSGPHPS